LRHCVNSAALSAMQANTQANTEGATVAPRVPQAGHSGAQQAHRRLHGSTRSAGRRCRWRRQTPAAAPPRSRHRCTWQGSKKQSGGVSELWVIWPCCQLCRAEQTMRRCAAPCCCCCHTPDEVAGGGIVRGIHNHVVLPHQLDCTGMPTEGISAEPRHKAHKEVHQASAPLWHFRHAMFLAYTPHPHPHTLLQAPPHLRWRV
jgi:hypothetical protein